MRIADRHGRPLSSVLSEYPEWELAYWKAWYAREPSDGRLVEAAVARLTRNFISVNSKKGRQPPKLIDLLTPDFWLENNRRRAARRDAGTFESVFREAGIRVITVKRK